MIVAGLYPKVATIRPSHSKKRPGWVRHFRKWDAQMSDRKRLHSTRQSSAQPFLLISRQRNSLRTAISHQISQVRVLEGFCDNYPRLCRDHVMEIVKNRGAFFLLQINAVTKKLPSGNCHRWWLWPVCKRQMHATGRQILSLAEGLSLLFVCSALDSVAQWNFQGRFLSISDSQQFWYRTTYLHHSSAVIHD